MPGGESDISLFWSKFQHHPAMAGHPLFLTENWQRKAKHSWRCSSRLRECRSLSGGGGAPERHRVGRGQGARSNSRQRQSLDENAPGFFTWSELQTAPMLHRFGRINPRGFLSWLNHFPQDVSHIWNMRYYFPPLRMGRTSYQPMTFLVKILMNPFQIL